MKIFYSAIFNDYDNIPVIKKQAGWEYILFTDKKVKSDTWTVVVISNQPKMFRNIKIRSHLYLPKHDRSVWMDANLSFGGVLDTLCTNNLIMWKHPDRTNCYDEAEACIILGKDSTEVIQTQMFKYENEGFHGQGLVATGMISRANTKQNAELNDMWWTEVKNHSLRDQLSFPYVSDKLGVKPFLLPFLQNTTRTPHKGKSLFERLKNS